MIFGNTLAGYLAYGPIAPVSEECVQFVPIQLPEGEILMSSLKPFGPANVILNRWCELAVILPLASVIPMSPVFPQSFMECLRFQVRRIDGAVSVQPREKRFWKRLLAASIYFGDRLRHSLSNLLINPLLDPMLAIGHRAEIIGHNFEPQTLERS
jgi:hypothetical protein